jgi:hypothetical protein
VRHERDPVRREARLERLERRHQPPGARVDRRAVVVVEAHRLLATRREDVREGAEPAGGRAASVDEHRERPRRVQLERAVPVVGAPADPRDGSTRVAGAHLHERAGPDRRAPGAGERRERERRSGAWNDPGPHRRQ